MSIFLISVSLECTVVSDISLDCFRIINRHMQMRAIWGAFRSVPPFTILLFFIAPSLPSIFFIIALRSKVWIAESGARNVYLFMTYETPKENEGWPTFAADRATSVGGSISGHTGRIILRLSLLCEDLKFWMKNISSDVRRRVTSSSKRIPIFLSSHRSCQRVTVIGHNFINFSFKCTPRFY